MEVKGWSKGQGAWRDPESRVSRRNQASRGEGSVSAWSFNNLVSGCQAFWFPVAGEVTLRDISSVLEVILTLSIFFSLSGILSFTSVHFMLHSVQECHWFHAHMSDAKAEVHNQCLLHTQSCSSAELTLSFNYSATSRNTAV